MKNRPLLSSMLSLFLTCSYYFSSLPTLCRAEVVRVFVKPGETSSGPCADPKTHQETLLRIFQRSIRKGASMDTDPPPFRFELEDDNDFDSEFLKKAKEAKATGFQREGGRQLFHQDQNDRKLCEICIENWSTLEDYEKAGCCLMFDADDYNHYCAGTTTSERRLQNLKNEDADTMKRYETNMSNQCLIYMRELAEQYIEKGERCLGRPSDMFCAVWVSEM